MLKKKIIPVFLASVLTVSGTTGFVTEAFSENVYAAEEVHTERLADFADLLDDGQEEELEAKLDQVSEDYGCDVVVVTEETLDGAVPQDYADDFYDYNGYGYGKDDDGILLLISMEDRDWALSTHGYGITAFTDAGCDYIAEQFKSSLSDGEYEKAFEIYIDQCDAFVTQAREDRPYDNSNLPKKPLGMIWIPVALVLGFICAFSIVGGMKRQLKTVARKTTAGNYQKKGSLKVTESRDLFLYEDVTRTAKPKSSDGDSGSSTHTSSSGETHGGSSGKF